MQALQKSRSFFVKLSPIFFQFCHVTGLRREVTEQDRAQLEYVMPLIQSGLNKTAKAFSDCIAVKDIVTSWYAGNISVFCHSFAC